MNTSTSRPPPQSKNQAAVEPPRATILAEAPATMILQTPTPSLPAKMQAAAESPRASIPVEVPKQLQPPEDEKIKSDVRKLGLYIAEHVREYYTHSGDVDAESIFEFKPVSGPGVEVAIRRYIALQALYILKRDEDRPPAPISIDTKLRHIHDALANYRRNDIKEGTCKEHLGVLLRHAVDLEKLLRLSPSKWDFGSLELRKPTRIDVVAFPAFYKGEKMILLEACEIVDVHPNSDARWGKRKIFAKATGNMLRHGKQRGNLPQPQKPASGYQDTSTSSVSPEESPAPPETLPNYTPSSPNSPLFRRVNSDPVHNSPPSQASTPWGLLTDPRPKASLLLLDLVIYLLCLIRLTLVGPDRLGVTKPGSIAVPNIKPSLPPYFEKFGGPISELMKGEAGNGSNYYTSTGNEKVESTQLESSSGTGAHAQENEKDVPGGQDKGHPKPRNEEAGD